MTEAFVTVYSYLEPVEHPGEAPAIAPYKAPEPVIQALAGASLLRGTGSDVPVDELDRQGRWRRIATGWGDLAEE